MTANCVFFGFFFVMLYLINVAQKNAGVPRIYLVTPPGIQGNHTAKGNLVFQFYLKVGQGLYTALTFIRLEQRRRFLGHPTDQGLGRG